MSKMYTIVTHSEKQALQGSFSLSYTFDGELWKCPYFKVHLELQQNAIPYTGKVYDVPYWHCEVSKRNLID